MIRQRVVIVDIAGYSVPYDCEYARYLKLVGFDPVMVTAPSAKKHSEFNAVLDEIAFPVYFIPEWGRGTPFRLLSYFVGIVLTLVISWREAIIHFQWIQAPIVEYIAMRLFPGKIAITFHNAKNHDSGRPLQLGRLFFRRADFRFFVSEATRDEFKSVHRYANMQESLVLPHFNMRLCFNRERENSLKKLRSVVFFGLVRPYKGADFFPVIADICLRNGLEFLVLGRWIGWDANTKRQIKATLRNKGATVIDRFIDDTEICNYLTNSESLFVLPYRSGSQSGIVHLLMAHRVPFVSTDVGDTGRMMRENHLERLLFQRTPESFQGVLRYANQSDFTGYQRLAARFDTEQIAKLVPAPFNKKGVCS